MQKQKLRVRLTGITPILGSVPMSKEIFDKFIATKAKTEAEKQGAASDSTFVREDEEEKATQFYRNHKGELVLRGYQIKGFLKEALYVLRDSLGITNAKSKADNYVFIDSTILIKREGQTVTRPDGFFQRPLKAMTMQGPRISLASSEQLDPEWVLEFTITLLTGVKGTPKSKALDMDMIREALDYGELKGLLQFRNGGFGSFTWEELDFQEN